MPARPVIAGRFELLAEVGSGGMGVVHRARDLESSSPAAVKILRGDGVVDPERFLLEARVLAELHHEAIVGYLAHGRTDDGGLYLAMEWVEGETLTKRLDTRGVTVAETVRVARCVAAALAEAHRQGVLHRDLKPSNLMLQAGDPARTRLIDFGVARRLGAESGMTKTGIAMGTPGYMAPEQARALRKIDHRADLFALGCIIYECLAGAPAFSGDNIAAVMAKIVMLDPAPIRSACPEAPRALEVLLGALLAKDPAQRPADADAVARALAALGDELPDQTRRPVERLTSSPTVAATPRAGAFACVVLACTAVDDEGRPAPLSAGDLDDLRERLELYDCGLEALADGTLLVTVDGVKADEVVARAARAALAMKRALPGGQVVLTARRQVRADPLGEAIDEGARVLATAQMESIFSVLGDGDDAGVKLDDLSASLMPGDFTVERRGSAHYLVGEARAQP